MGFKIGRGGESILTTVLRRRNFPNEKKRDLRRSHSRNDILSFNNRYRLGEKQFWVEGDLVWLGFSLNIPGGDAEYLKRNVASL